MAYEVTVKGLSTWTVTFGSTSHRFSEGVHVVDFQDDNSDPKTDWTADQKARELVAAAHRAIRGFRLGQEYGVFIRSTQRVSTDTVRTLHDVQKPLTPQNPPEFVRPKPLETDLQVDSADGELTEADDLSDEYNGVVEDEPGVFDAPPKPRGRPKKTA